MLNRYAQVLFTYSENPFWTRQKAMKPGIASPYVADQKICPNPLPVVRFVRRSLPINPHKGSQETGSSWIYPLQVFSG
jgi:hypothetical protein